MKTKQRTPCPTCGKKYANLELHYNSSVACRPSTTEKKPTTKKPSNKATKKKGKQKKKDGRSGKKDQHQVDVQTDLNSLKRPQEYLEFVTFMALPRTLRSELLGIEDETEGAFAAKYEVNKNTLTSWKKVAGFWEDVMAVRKDFFRQRSGDVLLSLETTCIKEGKGSDAKVYLTYTGEYSEKQETEHKVSPELAAALDKVAQTLG